jgi:hypothetical protein
MTFAISCFFRTLDGDEAAEVDPCGTLVKLALDTHPFQAGVDSIGLPRLPTQEF